MSGKKESRVLIAACENVTWDENFAEVHCPGRLHFRWGMSQAACDTCGGYSGVAVSAWIAVELAEGPS